MTLGGRRPAERRESRRERLGIARDAFSVHADKLHSSGRETQLRLSPVGLRATRADHPQSPRAIHE